MRDPALSHTSRPILDGSGQHVALHADGAPLPYAGALRLLAQSAAFRAYLTGVIAAAPFAALRWETPPIALDTVERAFEFVLVDDPPLERAPDRTVFGAWFDDAPPDVLSRAVPNLGRDATLVVPRGIGTEAACTHLVAFLRGAPAREVDALWQCVAEAVRTRLGAAPLWISTAGDGVAWLHIRLDTTPKYYAWRPYADAA